MRALPAVCALFAIVFGIATGCGSSAGTSDTGTANGDAGDDAAQNDDDGSIANAEAGTANGDGSTISIGSDGGIGGDGGGATTMRTVDMRPYKLVVPSSYSTGVAMPLVMLLHGYAEDSTSIDNYFGMSALAKSKGFLLALPDGHKDNLQLQYWNADDACCDLYNAKPDDVGYLHDIIQDVKSAYNVDAKRVYVAGHSNGGFMSHRMACDHADEIAAITSLAGMVWKDATKCNPVAPVSVLQVHGDADTVVNYNGGINPGGAYPSAPDTVATWASKNGCDATLADTGQTLDLVSTLPGAETQISRHTCTKGAAELWTIHGGPHIPTFQATWAATFYAFLEAHPKN